MNESNTGVGPDGEVARVCANCGSVLLGEHCYRCGQPVKGLVRHFSSILGDFFDSVFDSVFELDGRIWRTLPPLLLRPGFLRGCLQNSQLVSRRISRRASVSHTQVSATADRRS